MVDPVATLSTGPGLILAGAILAVVGMLLPSSAKGPKTLSYIGAAVAGMLGVGLIFGLGTLGAAPGTNNVGATYTVTAAAGEVQNTSNLVIDNLNHKIQVQVQCTSSCSSFSFGSGTVELNFTVARSDTGTQDASTLCRVNTIAQVAKSDGSGTYYPIVGQNADGTYKSDFERGPNAAPAVNNKQATLLLTGGGTNFARLNVTWSITAVGNQNAYNAADVGIEIAGQPWVITEILTLKA